MSYQHWRLEREDSGLAFLTFDKANESTNTFSNAALNELSAIADELAKSPPKGLAILSAKDNGFAAGADINQFTSFKSAEEAKAFTKLGLDVFDKIAALRFPTVAMVHGFCMGGGTELSLACTYRVMDDGPKTKMALPEVLIGIVPGWGGAMRMPKLIGAGQALDLMLTGRGVNGRSAKRMGLADVVTPRRHFMNAARMLLTNPPAPHKPSFGQAIADWPVIRNIVASKAASSVSKKVAQKHYPAPYAIIDLWQNYGGDPRKVPDSSPTSIASIFSHPTTANLIRIFKLQERMKAMGKDSSTSIRHVHVIGAGAMGGDIAAWCAFRGLTVTLQDLSAERIAPAIKRAAEMYKKRLKQPHLIQAAMDRLIPDPKADGVVQADLIIEAIVENPEIKKKLYADIEPRMKAGAILATNTSSIPLQQLSGVLKRPERLVGLHFFNPVAQMMLVEIVEGPQTSPEVMQAGIAFTRQIDKLPMPCKSAPGFLVNRVLSPYLHEAMLMLDEGIPGEIIDAAARDFGMPMGPIELADMVGLDICYAVGHELGKPGQKVPAKLQACIDAKHLGKKTGQGFYRWENGKPVKSGPRNDFDLVALADRMTLPAINEAIACVREGIVVDSDLADAGVIFGTGFAPHRGGPIQAAKARGKDELLKIMAMFEKQYGERFKADAGWQMVI
ncbi:MAG: enoyl-CoA hydratase/isomerase family protein [Betaproteobacteria bacterium]|nr:enoyl-CoA hydratase/isomerase family protein [Betaproteobacteria bacterium]